MHTNHTPKAPDAGNPQLTESPGPTAVPAARGIHRRAAFAEQHATAGSAGDRYHAVVATFVLLVIGTQLGGASGASVAVAACLTLLAAAGQQRSVARIVTPLMAVSAGAFGLQVSAVCAAGMLIAWLPWAANRRHDAALWAAGGAAPGTVLALTGTPEAIVWPLLGGALWWAGERLWHARLRRGEAVFDHREAEAVIAELQGRVAAAALAPDRLMAAAARRSRSLIVVCDTAGTIQSVNAAAADFVGLSVSALTGASIDAHLRMYSEDSAAGSDASFTRHIERCAGRHQTHDLPSGAGVVAQPSGLACPVSGSIAPNGDGTVLVWIDDISEWRDTERLAEFYATHDQITGLPGLAQLRIALARTVDMPRPMALCILDLDHFKTVADGLGYNAASALLRDISNAMQRQLEPEDGLYSLGQDVFALLLHGDTESDLRAAVEALHTIVGGVPNQPAATENGHTITASVGAVVLPTPPLDGEALLAQASVARSIARRRGGNRVNWYAEEDPMTRHEGTSQRWTAELKDALADDRLLVFLQPIAALQEGLPERAELLLRLEDQGGQIWAPEHFLGAAERHHLMPRVDRWVLEHTLTALGDPDSELQSFGVIALNVSPQSLSDADFRASLLETIALHPTFAARLCLEVTESSVLAELAPVSQLLTDLRALGCSIALDDFGAGFSTYGYLKNLPADVLKIDGSFIVEMQRDAVDRTMVDSINRLAHRLGLRTVAEYVGDQQTAETLARMGVDYAQGEYVGRARRLRA
ncbi:MAG: EAL domain-containing protein [Pseudomonadota bacterium]